MVLLLLLLTSCDTDAYACVGNCEQLTFNATRLMPKMKTPLVHGARSLLLQGSLAYAERVHNAGLKAPALRTITIYNTPYLPHRVITPSHGLQIHKACIGNT